MEKKNLFVCFSSHEYSEVSNILTEIERRTGINCWVDTDCIKAGMEFVTTTLSAIESAKAFLFFYSASAESSGWVRKEVLYAKEHGRLIIPVLLETPSSVWAKLFFKDMPCYDGRDESNLSNLCEFLRNLYVEEKGVVPSSENTHDTKAGENCDVFLSYSRKDSEMMKKLTDKMDVLGISYFIDVHGIKSGATFLGELAAYIQKCKIFLFLGSKHAYDSTFVVKELLYAIEQKKKVIPYIIDDAKIPNSILFAIIDLNRRQSSNYSIESLVEDIYKELDNH